MPRITGGGILNFIGILLIVFGLSCVHGRRDGAVFLI